MPVIKKQAKETGKKILAPEYITRKTLLLEQESSTIKIAVGWDLDFSYGFTWAHNSQLATSPDAMSFKNLKIQNSRQEHIKDIVEILKSYV